MDTTGTDKVLRCTVDTLEPGRIGATEKGSGRRISVAYQGEYWGYLEKIAAKGSRLNIVAAAYDKGKAAYVPGLVIYEPDYLVNVTTVASCFETYAESPYVHLVNKLKQPANTEHIHLGNLAGKFLDDAVHRHTSSFTDSFNAFFRDNALAMVACDAMHDSDALRAFYKNAKTQKGNIERTVAEELPAAIPGYDPKDARLEPAFFCEALGLQGRMDFLWEGPGQRVVIEQKSGKGAFPRAQQDPDTPMPQEKHLVQLALYRAVFDYGIDWEDSHGTKSLLYYSKYRHGLVDAPIPAELLLRSIRMRNLIAWCEMGYAGGGADILTRLTPEMLNRKNLRGRLWESYVRPGLEEVLRPVREAPKEERAYCLRFMQFVEKEQLLSKTGGNATGRPGFSSLWNDTIEEKEAAGNILHGLAPDLTSVGRGAVEEVGLLFKGGRECGPSNFRPGDIVVAYPYKDGTVPDVRRQMAIRATIKELADDRVTLQLRSKQPDGTVFRTPGGISWAVEHDLFDSSSAAFYPGLHSLLTATEDRRDLLMCRRPPMVDGSAKPVMRHGDFGELAARAAQARELFIIIGPPGTGKTSFGLTTLLKEELAHPGSHILLMAYTNRAVDEICGKLEECGIDYARIGSRLSCDPQYAGKLLRNRLAGCTKGEEVEAEVKGTRVYCATTAAMNANPDLLKLMRFDLAIIDEASQILEPHIAGLLCARHGAVDAIGKIVLIGDHKQLPAVVLQQAEDSAVEQPGLRAIGVDDCRRSFFERMLGRFKDGSGYDPRFVYMLTKQGRMHPDIADFPNKAFYGGRLQAVPLPHQLRRLEASGSPNGIARLLSTRRVAFVASEKPRTRVPDKTNPVEAAMVAATVEQVRLLAGDAFNPGKTVGVIVPYRNQIAEVRKAIGKTGTEGLDGITIDTVERYQGSQRDYIVYSFTITGTAQLAFLTDNVFAEDGVDIDRKLNVAMTRAKEGLVMIGNPEIMKEAPVFRSLMEYVRGKGGYLDITPEAYCKGDFTEGDL